MTVITIPRTMMRGTDDLVVIPRKEYEMLAARPAVREYVPTAADIRRARTAERAMKRGEGLTFDEFTKQLDAARRARRR